MHDRQIDLFNPDDVDTVRVAIIGCGSIGSFVAMTLAKMGIRNFLLYDSDTVEEHNVSNQFFNKSHIGLSKTMAIQGILRTEHNIEFETYDNIEAPDDIAPCEVIIACTDNMPSRKMAYEAYKKCPSSSIFIDARMGGELFSVFSVMAGAQLADDVYFDDSEAVDLPCTARTIVYNVLGVASVIAAQLKKMLYGEQYKKEINFSYKSMEIY